MPCHMPCALCSGPFRFDCAGAGRWVYSRDGHDLVQQLQDEMGVLTGSPLQMEA